MTSMDDLPDPEDEFWGGIWWVKAHDAFGLRSAAPGECAAEIKRLRGVVEAAEAEARRYAGFYPEASDGRNTFVLLADRIAELSGATLSTLEQCQLPTLDDVRGNRSGARSTWQSSSPISE